MIKEEFKMLHFRQNVIELKPRKSKSKKRNCNLCNQVFSSKSPFDRFCAHCKRDSELLHFSEWLSGELNAVGDLDLDRKDKVA